MNIRSLFQGAYLCLVESDLERKIGLSFFLSQSWKNGLNIFDNQPLPDVIKPGRPSKPHLVNPNELPSRGTGTKEGRLALMHAIAHIEFNAINLAWDVIFRFRDLPKIFYTDWVKVAREETIYFNLIRKYLLEHDCDYGDFDSHDGL